MADKLPRDNSHAIVFIGSIFGDTAQVRILYEMVFVQDFEWTKVQLGSGANVPRKELERILPALVEHGIILESRAPGNPRVKLYKLNLRNRLTRKIVGTFLEINRMGVQEAVRSAKR